jgi:hypothetical protein
LRPDGFLHQHQKFVEECESGEVAGMLFCGFEDGREF